MTLPKGMGQFIGWVFQGEFSVLKVVLCASQSCFLLKHGQGHIRMVTDSRCGETVSNLHLALGPMGKFMLRELG